LRIDCSGCETERASTEQITALTSLPPGFNRVRHHTACIASWRRAGLKVISFNHPSEIVQLRRLYDVEFVPVTNTAAAIFGRDYIPITSMLTWAAAERRTVLLINADIELQMQPGDLQRIRLLSDGGLCYFIRCNYDANRQQACEEPYGIDAFLLSSIDAGLFHASFLSMGQPFWDYWLPHAFFSRDRELCAVAGPVLLHKSHPRQWSTAAWHRCALEFDRLYPHLGADKSVQACERMSARVRAEFDSRKRVLPLQPFSIRQWVERKFSNGGKKVFFEIGAHDGSDTVWMARIADVTLHAFEPDPRNNPPALANVVLNRCAVSQNDGRAPFVLSETGWGMPWTYSSSLRRPKNHLARYPVAFGSSIEVQATSLDAYAARHGIETVDFIWADIQGAEGDMILGGRELLRRTRYLYTEYSDEEMYEGQVSLSDIRAMLPKFRVLEVWPDDVLLENRELSGP
jgi:FkbM family methyltransferase